MTEAEWLASSSPTWLLSFLRERISNRKGRLFACACCRRASYLLKNEQIRKALDVAEDYADGLIADRVRQQCQQEAWTPYLALLHEPFCAMRGLACVVARDLLSPDDEVASRRVHSGVANAVKRADNRAATGPVDKWFA